jgi:hypothetical protein
MRDQKMFTALFNKFNADQEPNYELIQANEALQERVAHMFWKPSLERNSSVREMKPVPLVKKPISIRKAIAA